MKYFFSLIVVFLFCSAGIYAQQPPIIDREIFFGDPEISGAQISPDGKFISFRKQFNGVMNIWVKDIDQKFDEARPLTADSLRPVRGYFWSRDSKYILFVQDKGGDENYRVYAVDPKAKGDPVPLARDLTPLEKVRAEIIDVPKNIPDKIIIGLNDRDPKVHDVYWLNLATGDRTLIRKNTDNISGWFTDLNGNLKLGLRMTPDGGSELLELLKDNVKSIYKVNSEETFYPLRYTPDDNAVYMLTNKGNNIDKAELQIFNLKTGETKFVDKDPENEVDVSSAIFSDISNKLLATVYVGDKLRIYPKDEHFAEVYNKLKKAISEGNYNISSWTADEKIWVISVSRDVDPGSAYIFNSETGNAELLYKSRPQLNNKDLSKMEPLTFKARDGMTIHAYLTLPKGLPDKNLPVVMWIHGGPWARDMWGYDPYVQFLANRGYAVVQPNYRGSNGYGKKYLNAGNKQWGRGAMQNDITDCVKYLIDKKIADPKRVAIAGGSYGGYATLAGLAFTPDIYAAGFDIVGPSNIITLLKSVPPYWEPIKKMFDVRVGDMNNPEDLEMLNKNSPLNYATDIKAPLYVVQGANDPRVNKSESDRIVAALRDLGRPVEYMVAPDEGHGFSGEENRLAMMVAMENFIAKYLGGRVQEDVSAAIQKKLDQITVDIKSVALTKPEETTGNIVMLKSFDGSRLSEGSESYKLKVNAGGNEMNSDLKATIIKSNLGGKDIWRVISETNGMLNSIDTLEVDAITLLPLRRVANQGQAVVNLTFMNDSAKGVIEAGMQKIPVNIKLDEPTVTDGMGEGLMIATLPLAVGYKAQYNQLDLMKGSTRKINLEVIGIEEVETPSGKFETFKISLKPVEEDGGQATVWYDRSNSRLIKMQSKVPAQAGGATVELLVVD